MVKVIAERLQGSQVLLNIEVEPERVEKTVERAYRRISSRVNIPGFRRGKAPRQIIERYVGKETLLAEGLDLVVDEVYREAVSETGIKPIAQPDIDVPPDYTLGSTLQVRATVAVFPTIELGDYQSIRLTPVEVDATPEQVNSVVDRLREQHAEWVPVEREVRQGDRIVATIRGRAGVVPRLYGPGGETLIETEGSTSLIEAEHEEFVVGPSLDENTAPGLSERVVGLSPHRTADIELSLPEDYASSELAGKNAIFSIEIEEIKEKRLPDLDDEFAKSVSDAQTFDELRQQIHDTVKERLSEEARRVFETSMVRAVVARSQIELPSQLVSHEIDHMLEDLTADLRAAGLKRDDYFRIIGRSEADVRNELHDNAVRRLENALALEALAEAEHIEAAPAEIDAEIELVASTAGEQAERARRELSTSQSRARIESILCNRKLIARLTEIATSPAPEGQEGQDAAESPAASESGQTPIAVAIGAAEAPEASEGSGSSADEPQTADTIDKPGAESEEALNTTEGPSQ